MNNKNTQNQFACHFLNTGGFYKKGQEHLAKKKIKKEAIKMSKRFIFTLVERKKAHISSDATLGVASH